MSIMVPRLISSERDCISPKKSVEYPMFILWLGDNLKNEERMTYEKIVDYY